MVATLSRLILVGIAASSVVAVPGNRPLEALNSSVNGKVRAVEPFGLPCFSSFEGHAVKPDPELCAERQENNRNPLYRTEIPGAYMYDFSSIDASDKTSTNQCLLDYNDPTNPAAWEGRDCRLGNLPSHYLEVEGPEEVIEAFKYARKSGASLSVKNSGHSYVEDSTKEDSLVLWTRKLQHLSHDESFVPKGCPSTTKYDTITTGAGVNCGEAYRYAESQGKTILCGYSPTVGLSGGWVQMAGHSVLSNVYGLGADRVVQFTVVTADGKVRTANECQNRDLYWALRGGGGGTYGVVLESTHKVEGPTEMSVAQITVDRDDDTIAKFMDLLVDTAIDLAEDGWGGHIYGDHIVYVNPVKTTVESATRSLAKISKFASAHGGAVNITTAPTWYSFFEDVVLGGSYAVGNLNLIGTQLAPAALFTTAKGRSSLKSFFRDQISLGAIPYIPVDSPYLIQKKHHNKHPDTSVLPAWYDSLWEIGVGGQWAWNMTFDERQAVANRLKKDTAMVQQLTGGAAYKNEADPFTPNWQKNWFGSNYERLEKIKHKYDPSRLLNCWGCVGWTRKDAEKSTYKAFI